jgi:hypothetical protein
MNCLNTGKYWPLNDYQQQQGHLAALFKLHKAKNGLGLTEF